MKNVEEHGICRRIFGDGTKLFKLLPIKTLLLQEESGEKSGNFEDVERYKQAR